MTGALHIDTTGKIFERLPIDDIAGGQTIRIGHMMPVEGELAEQFPDGRLLLAEVDYTVTAEHPVMPINESLGIRAIHLQSGGYVPIDPTLVVFRERQA